MNPSNKPVGEDVNRHVQKEGDDYIVTSGKLAKGGNGCVISSNHITIRSNPLADVDSKVR